MHESKIERVVKWVLSVTIAIPLICLSAEVIELAIR